MTFLYGAPASGKTTLGQKLAEALHVDFVDLDAAIVKAEGRSIAAIFAASGEEAFRKIESDTLIRVLSSQKSSCVVALGGGTLLRTENRRLCETHGTVLCLDTPPSEELARRMNAAQGMRPLGNRAEERAAHYASFPSRLTRSFDLPHSLVLVGTNFAPALLENCPLAIDETVNRLHGTALPPPLSVIPSGESNKTPETVMALWHAFARHGLGRHDRVAAVGGGVTGDLTGFAAATWMRGMDWINVPTTLLAMVDASTGGKTGCDLPEGKNLAGVFHTPRLVVIDTAFLKTLPPALMAAGRAEMIKHAIVGGLPTDSVPTSVPTASGIADNLGIKVAIVREDPFERTGRRILLNCGHTVAHAVETLTDYRVSHGEAVAIGCVCEARLAVHLGLATKSWPTHLANVFAAAGLSADLPAGLTVQRLIPVMRGDKKRQGNCVTFALPCAWGDVRAVPIDLSKEIAL